MSKAVKDKLLIQIRSLITECSQLRIVPRGDGYLWADEEQEARFRGGYLNLMRVLGEFAKPYESGFEFGCMSDSEKKRESVL